jgi:hypothetical protein
MFCSRKFVPKYFHTTSKCCERANRPMLFIGVRTRWPHIPGVAKYWSLFKSSRAVQVTWVNNISFHDRKSTLRNPAIELPFIRSSACTVGVNLLVRLHGNKTAATRGDLKRHLHRVTKRAAENCRHIDINFDRGLLSSTIKQTSQPGPS